VLNELISDGKFPAASRIFPGRGHRIGDHPESIEKFERMPQFLADNP